MSSGAVIPVSSAEAGDAASVVLQTLHAKFIAATDARIRDTLAPLLRESSQAAHSLGGAPEVRDERTWHIGRAQGLLDALRALAPVFGGELPGPVVTPDSALPDAAEPEWPVAGAHRSVS